MKLLRTLCSLIKIFGLICDFREPLGIIFDVILLRQGLLQILCNAAVYNSITKLTLFEQNVVNV